MAGATDWRPTVIHTIPWPIKSAGEVVVSLPEYLEQKKREYQSAAGWPNSGMQPLMQAERGRGPHGRTIAEAIARGQITHEEGMQKIDQYWRDAKDQQAAWQAEKIAKVTALSEEISEIESFIAQRGTPSINSSDWTGRPPTNAQVVAVKLLAPDARAGLEMILSEGRINDPDVIDKLERLRDTLSQLSDAANDEASFPKAYAKAKEKFGELHSALDNAFWKATTSPLATLGILFIVGMIFGVSWANIVGNSLMTHAVKEKGAKEPK